MANLKLIKDLAAIKGLSIDQLAAKAKISTQAIHLMGRNGTTKMETFEKIAEILEVPPYVFYDENFDVQMFRDYVVQGHHNPTSFFGPIYNGGSPPFQEKNSDEQLKEESEMIEEKTKELRELVKSKEETIKALQIQIEELRADKEYFRSEVLRLRKELQAVKDG